MLAGKIKTKCETRLSVTLLMPVGFSMMVQVASSNTLIGAMCPYQLPATCSPEYPFQLVNSKSDWDGSSDLSSAEREPDGQKQRPKALALFGRAREHLTGESLRSKRW